MTDLLWKLQPPFFNGKAGKFRLGTEDNGITINVDDKGYFRAPNPQHFPLYAFAKIVNPDEEIDAIANPFRRIWRRTLTTGLELRPAFYISFVSIMLLATAAMTWIGYHAQPLTTLATP